MKNKKIILAKYTFTIYIEDGKRYIHCEYPPVPTLLDIDNIYSFCIDKRKEEKRKDVLPVKKVKGKPEKKNVKTAPVKATQ